jgi:hypothetical protein
LCCCVAHSERATITPPRHHVITIAITPPRHISSIYRHISSYIAIAPSRHHHRHHARHVIIIVAIAIAIITQGPLPPEGGSLDTFLSSFLGLAEELGF